MNGVQHVVTQVRMSSAFVAPKRESREVFGIRMLQDGNDHQVTGADLAEVVCGALTSEAKRDLLLGLVAIKYTQSNSVGYALGGQMISVGAGQQSRIDCTKLASTKADLWSTTSTTRASTASRSSRSRAGRCATRRWRTRAGRYCDAR